MNSGCGFVGPCVTVINKKKTLMSPSYKKKEDSNFTGNNSFFQRKKKIYSHNPGSHHFTPILHFQGCHCESWPLILGAKPSWIWWFPNFVERIACCYRRKSNWVCCDLNWEGVRHSWQRRSLSCSLSIMEKVKMLCGKEKKNPLPISFFGWHSPAIPYSYIQPHTPCLIVESFPIIGILRFFLGHILVQKLSVHKASFHSHAYMGFRARMWFWHFWGNNISIS